MWQIAGFKLLPKHKRFIGKHPISFHWQQPHSELFAFYTQSQSCIKLLLMWLNSLLHLFPIKSVQLVKPRLAFIVNKSTCCCHHECCQINKNWNLKDGNFNNTVKCFGFFFIILLTANGVTLHLAASGVQVESMDVVHAAWEMEFTFERYSGSITGTHTDYHLQLQQSGVT